MNNTEKEYLEAVDRTIEKEVQARIKASIKRTKIAYYFIGFFNAIALFSIVALIIEWVTR